MKSDVPTLDLMSGNDLVDAMLESSLSEDTKREVFEWLWAKRLLDNKQYKLAVSRIEHLENKPT